MCLCCVPTAQSAEEPLALSVSGSLSVQPGQRRNLERSSLILRQHPDGKRELDLRER